MKKSLAAAVAAMLTAVVIAGVAGYRWASAHQGAAAAEASRWKSAEAELRGRLASLEKERDALRAGQPVTAPEVEKAPVMTSRTPKVVLDDSVSRQALVQLVEEKERQLTAAESSLRELQGKLQELTSRLEQVQEQQSKAQASEAALRERLDAATQQTAMLEAAGKTREGRLAEVEAANLELRKRADDSGKRLERLRQVSGDLEDLARRREAFLTNILGRYREATDLFRAMSVRLEHPREGGGVPVSTSDVSRLQNTVSLAEEDMRQLRGLNARASALQKDLREMNPQSKAR